MTHYNAEGSAERRQLPLLPGTPIRLTAACGHPGAKAFTSNPAKVTCARCLGQLPRIVVKPR